MISFLEQGLLWLLGASLIPILIHLINRRRHRTVLWAASEFLLQATRQSKGKKRLKHWVILSCRALAIAAIAIIASRPIISDFLNWNTTRIDTVIFVLDRSASMEQQLSSLSKSKRAYAIETVQNSLKSLGNPRLVLLDSATQTPQDILSPQSLQELASSSSTHTSASLPSLILKATQYASEQKTGQTEIWVASDLQASNWKPNDSSWAQTRAALKEVEKTCQLRILDLQGQEMENFSIQVRSIQRKDHQIIIDYEVSSHLAQHNHEVIVHFHLGESRITQKVPMQGHRLLSQKVLQLNSSAPQGYGYLQLEADANPHDNTAFFTYSEHHPSLGVIVSQQHDQSSVALQHAVALPNRKNQQVEVYQPDESHKINWKQTSLLIWQAPLPRGQTAQAIKDYLHQGGVVVFFPPLENDSTSFLNMQWGNRELSSENVYFVADSWNQNDGPLKNGANGMPLAVDSLKAIQRVPLIGEATHLATWDDQSTLVARKYTQKRGLMLFVGTLPD